VACGVGETEVNRKQLIAWISIGVVAAVMAIAFGVRLHRWREGATRIRGAVIRRDDDPQREMPISDVLVTASDGVTTATTKSDASGYFNLPFQGGVWPGHVVTLTFSHSNYERLDIKLESGLGFASHALYVAALVLKPAATETGTDSPQVVVSNIKVRYSVNSLTKQNIGSTVKTFQVTNKGDIPCDHQSPCSPDGRWKAARGTASLDAGADNDFSNVRVSCIAGPCPFTRIESRDFTQSGRYINVSAMTWSDTATFLVEAEVLHTAVVSNVRESYPLVFGRALNFTLPPTEEGVSLEAELDGTPMVFPLGPELYLSWATCTAGPHGEEEKTTVYRCELKPGYRF
jgi:hypothetical protein